MPARCRSYSGGLEGAQILWPRSEQLTRQEVQLGCLIDRLDRVTAEQLITPGDQRRDVLHHDRLLVGHRPRRRDEVRIEGFVTPVGNLLLQLSIVLTDELQQRLDLLRRVVRARQVTEHARVPVALRRSAAGHRRGIKDVVKPRERIREPLIVGEPLGDQ